MDESKNQKYSRRSENLSDEIIVMLLQKTDALEVSVRNLESVSESLGLTQKQTQELIDKLSEGKLDTPKAVLVYRTYKKSVIAALLGMLAAAVWAALNNKIQAAFKVFVSFWRGL